MERNFEDVDSLQHDPTVTVLIDNYNYGQFLAHAVDSALNQTYPSVEVLVVDDGSTDSSHNVLDGYGSRIRVLKLENGGQARLVNTALPHVRSDLTFVLDSDDALAPDAVARVVAEFQRDPLCVRVQFRLDVVDAQGQLTGATMPPLRVPLLTGDLRPILMRHRGMRWSPTSGNAWSTAALRKLPLIPEDSFRWHFDRWWSDLVGLLGTVRGLERTGGLYRVHGANHSMAEDRLEPYFLERIRRREILHGAAKDVAAGAGLGEFPPTPEDMVDAAYSSWLLASRKLGADRDNSRPSRRRGAQRVVRSVGACLRQPDKTFRTRAGHAGWYLLLLSCPAGTPAARLVVRRRYGV